MFDWFWDFLYTISEILYELIDALLAIANKLCGIEPIMVGDRKANFMLELFKDSRVFMGFAGAAIIGIFLLMLFSMIAICRNCKDGKKSNGQIALEVFKTLGLFFVVPSLMVGFTLILNELVVLLYKATSSTTPSLGAFLFENFLPDEMTGFSGTYDYTSTQSVRNYMAGAGFDLSDYRFFFSWIISLPILFFVARSMLLFVERCISIVLLFVMSPISLSTTVLDDGARFKIWRDKVIAKFISGYGMIIGLNIYILVLSFITRSDVQIMTNVPIISDRLCNFLLKICIALGGAFFLPKVFGLVGDLFVQGAASGDFQAAHAATDGMAKTMGAIKKALFDEDENKKKKDNEDAADKEKLKSLGGGKGAAGGAAAAAGPAGALAALAGSSNGNHSSTLGKIFDTGKKIVKAITGNPNENNNEGQGNQGGKSNNNENNNDKFKNSNPLAKIVDTTKEIIKKTGEVAGAVGNSGREGGGNQ